MRKVSGNIRRMLAFVLAAIITVQIGTVTPVFADESRQTLEVEIFISKRDMTGPARDDYYYIGKAMVSYPSDISLDKIYIDNPQYKKNGIPWGDAGVPWGDAGVKVEFDIKKDVFEKAKICQNTKQFYTLDGIKTAEESSMNASVSWIILRRRDTNHWHIEALRR